MEKGQSEVTNKIRSAIKQKLADISDFVDDELPEYIMILVANQRSKSQIEKDLSLFLRKDTVNFTNWLWDLLNNLKVGAKNNQSSVPKIDSDVLKKDIEADEDAVVLDFDPDEHETDFLSHEDTNDSFISKSSVQPSSFQTNEVKKETSVTKSTQNYKLVQKNKIEFNSPVKALNKIEFNSPVKALSKIQFNSPVKALNKIEFNSPVKAPNKIEFNSPVKAPNKIEFNSPVKAAKNASSQSSKEPLSSAVISVKRKFTDSEDEYDPAKPEYERASCSSNTRNYGGPAALQANKLLLKAVDDAAKSIFEGKNIEDYYKPTPIKVLTSKRYNNPLSRRDESMRKKSSLQEIIPQPELTTEVPDPEVSEFDPNEYPPDVLMEDDIDYPVSSQRSRTICLKPIPLVSNSPDFENSEYIPERNYTYSFPAVEEVRPKSPHFIVTLDGVSRTTFKRKFEENSVDSMEEDEEEEEEDRDELVTDEVTTPEKKLKLNERCKYWPACKNSDQCSYHHPTIPCKCFPDCKFGDKCLYIHPNCKFDALCSRKDCPFTHASKRKLPLIAVPVKMIPLKSRRMKVVCKFYPKCASKNCPFIHPKLCRYGTDCRLPACLYGHFPVPSRSQMKWQAAIS